jgi:acyl-lipid omega-6 desaturase (Delta-12 desaturase)
MPWIARVSSSGAALSGAAFRHRFSADISRDNMAIPTRRKAATVPLNAHSTADTHQPRADRDVQRDARRALLASLAPFQGSSAWRSILQLTSTGLAYAAAVAAMYATVQFSFWLTLALSLPAAGLVVRIFIIQHDCGHGSYFHSSRANEVLGWFCSAVTFTPYANWRRQHAGHHAVWNNLDERHSGADIYSACLTLQEYLDLPARRRWFYRITRHPIIAQIILPPLIFLLLYRVPFDAPRTWHKERRGVHFTNLALAAMLSVLVVLLGWKQVLMVQLPIMIFASIAGVWLFSVQHRFEDSEWLRQDRWTHLRASLNGSSYLRLPRALQWFTGSIGFHHIHHLLPRVPNYRLEACHEALLARGGVVRMLTLSEAFLAPSFALWDEARHRMVPFPPRRLPVSQINGIPPFAEPK